MCSKKCKFHSRSSHCKWCRLQGDSLHCCDHTAQVDLSVEPHYMRYFIPSMHCCTARNNLTHISCGLTFPAQQWSAVCEAAWYTLNSFSLYVNIGSKMVHMLGVGSENQGCNWLTKVSYENKMSIRQVGRVCVCVCANVFFLFWFVDPWLVAHKFDAVTTSMSVLVVLRWKCTLAMLHATL